MKILKKVCEEHNITDIDDLKVYTLIFFNTICSQSKNAIYENTTLNFKVKTRSFKCSFSQLKSKGFKAIKDLEEEKKLVASYVNNRENISSIKEQNEIAHETIRLQSAFEVWDFFEKLVSYEHSIYTNVNLTQKISIINIALISKTQANIEISAQFFNKEKLESKKRYRIIMTFEFEPIEIDTKSVPLNPTGFIVTGYDVTEIAILKDLDEKNKVKDDGVKSRIIHTEKKDPHMSQYKDVKEQ
ncbi:VirB8/TrbF family protein [Helicobacter pylori]|uniref:type IV secretion system protein n=1 Tax=Helicobacter pylori TaxID=210 RepID=UPI0023D94849|nr:VirB8/TrbF family protein [Helicobacter pylori]